MTYQVKPQRHCLVTGQRRLIDAGSCRPIIEYCCSAADATALLCAAQLRSIQYRILSRTQCFVTVSPKNCTTVQHAEAGTAVRIGGTEPHRSGTKTHRDKLQAYEVPSPYWRVNATLIVDAKLIKLNVKITPYI